MKYHWMGFALGCILDRCIGDPHGLWHPVRVIGAWIAFWDRLLLGRDMPERDAPRHKRLGIVLVIVVLVPTVLAAIFIYSFAYRISPILGVVIEGVMTAYLLAARSLETESMRVYDALRFKGLVKAREAVAMIVGRDTDSLDEAGVLRAAVETVAENTTDGVIAPMLYTALGGPVMGYAYKAISTLDSMVGYRNERYYHFGTPAARCDDVAAFVPARVAAGLMLLAVFILNRVSFFTGQFHYDLFRALRVFRRDRLAPESPNAGQTESVAAGALGLQLAGDAKYFGRWEKKPVIGDDTRPIVLEDIPRVNRLMWGAAWLGAILCLGWIGMGVLYGL